MLRRLLGSIVILAGLLAAAWVFLVVLPLRIPHPALQPAHGVIAVRDARVYVSPDLPPLEHANVVIRDGVVAAVGPQAVIPREARLLTCEHCVVTAGFWNAHVHFTEDKWSFADWKSSRTLDAQLSDMLNSRGFTTVVDTGSDLRITVSLRRRIEAGELLGPRIYTAGMGQYPPHGIPFYIRENMPRPIQSLLLQPDTPAEAARAEEQNIRRGADVLKLFTGSYVTRDRVLPMPEANAEAAVAVAHGHGQLAFAHPSDLAGVLVALHSGVDVLAHAPDSTDGINAVLLQSLIDHGVWMIPTLKMFASTVTRKAAYLDPIYAVVRQFHAQGGRLLFGTDVGYMRDYDTREEFDALGKSGLDAMDILRMLTTAPAERFGVIAEQGRIAVGQRGDLVVLKDDPSTDVTAFARVGATVRAGRIIFQAH